MQDEKQKQDNKSDEKSSIDLSKMSMSDYKGVYDRVSKGTPFGTFIKIGAGVFGLLGLVTVPAYNLGAHYSKSDTQEPIAQKQISGTESSNKASDPMKNAPNDNQAANCESVQQTCKKKLDEQQDKIKLLQDDLSKKPSVVNCISYGTEYDRLVGEKNNIENRIQLLLNPPLTQQQLAQGMAYTPDQLNTYSRQAAEYRKTADDVQRQIISIQELRKNCN